MLRYVNHMGESIDLDSGAYLMDIGTIRDYAWQYQSSNDRISSFSRPAIAQKECTILIRGIDALDAAQKRNSFFSLVEKDVLAMMPGKLWVDDYYLSCYIVSSTKSGHVNTRRFGVIGVTILTDSCRWVREDTVSFGSGIENVEGYGYPYGCPYGYPNSMTSQRVINSGIAPLKFRATVYGPVTSPSFAIGGHYYTVDNAGLLDGEYMVIDQVEKTIVKVGTSGDKTNLFANRSAESYIFEPVPTGASVVSWDGSFGFDITLIHERSEPEWT